MLVYKCEKDRIQVPSSICPVCNQRALLESSNIFWCAKCNIPTYDERCENCGEITSRVTTDIRPVFPEERLLVEIIQNKPFQYESDSVWNGAGNKYFVNGKKIAFSIGNLKNLDINNIRQQFYELVQTERFKNSYQKYNQIINCFIKANQSRYKAIVNEATEYLKTVTEGYTTSEMFISFSGGKDSTVTADLVMRALSNPKILHIFGDTTLEFPETMKYVERYSKEHPTTPVISSRNRDKNFEELCQIVGPPSRVMRWCCTIFKTGAIQRKISTLFRNQKKILTFYGIRRSESTSRSKYERESLSPKITKQITISPIIDWMDFDIWLYLLTTKIDFNYAYRLGYARVGCWCCPNNSAWSEFLSRIHMPEESAHFRELLVNFARSIGKLDAEDYVDDGFWKARQGGNGVEYAKKANISFTPCAVEENAFNYELSRPITDELYELFKPFGYINFNLGNEKLGEVFVVNMLGEVVIKLTGRINTNLLKVTVLKPNIAGATNVRTAEEKIKCQLTKYQMCMGCLACESVCKHNAISIHEDDNQKTIYKIDDKKCLRCSECVGHYTAGCYMRKVLVTKRG